MSQAMREPGGKRQAQPFALKADLRHVPQLRT
jgi:hypothetical protein